MTRTILLVLSVGLWTAPLVASPVGTNGTRTFDGRFGSKCLSWGRDTTKELCQVSFYKLLANPERYDGKMISVSGYLVRAFDRLVLFPNRERYEADAQIEGIEIDESGSLPDDLKSKIEGGAYPVTVLGSFDAKYVGADVPRLGLINHVVSISLPVLKKP